MIRAFVTSILCLLLTACAPEPASYDFILRGGNSESWTFPGVNTCCSRR